MARYKVRGPDGKEHELEGPEGATDEQVIAQAKTLFADKLPPAVEADRKAMLEGDTEPPEQKLLTNTVSALSGATLPSGVAAIGKGIAKLGTKAVAEATPGIRARVAAWLGKQAEQQAVKAAGPTTTNLADIGARGGPDAVRQTGRYMLDKGIVKSGASAEDMLANVQPLKEAAGKAVGSARELASSRGASPTAEEISATIKERLGKKYSEGLHAGEAGELENAVTQLQSNAPKDFSELSSTATDMNAFAKSRNAMQQPSGATTDAANIVAGESDAGMAKLLSPEEQAGYSAAKDEYGITSNVEQMLDRTQYREMANGVTMPVSRLGVMQRGLNAVLPHSRLATWSDKIGKTLATNPQAFGKNSQILVEAIKRGKGALGSVIYMLQQQDPEFKQQMTEMNSQKETPQ